jgi:hypothetical protein
MPKKQVALASLSDLYRAAFDSCAALWPIFILRIVFLFFNLTLFILGLVICCWPFLQELLSHWDEFNRNNFKNVMSEINWSGYFGDFKMLILVALFGAFYITFIFFFLAFFDAAIYSQLNQHQKNGSVFSWKSFFDGGIQKMIPMVGLQCAWLLVILGVICAFGFVSVLGVFIAKLLPWWIGLLLALPAGLGMVLALMVFMTAGALSAPYLVDGHGIVDSIKKGFDKALQNKGRAIGANLLLTLIYFVFFTAFTIVFAVLSMMPFIGILFVIFKFLVTSVLAIGYQIYLASLNVTLQLEPEESR